MPPKHPRISEARAQLRGVLMGGLVASMFSFAIFHIMAANQSLQNDAFIASVQTTETLIFAIGIALDTWMAHRANRRMG